MQLIRPTRVEGYDAIRLRSTSANVDATFVPRAGMVGASLRDRGEEVLGLGSGVHCYARGGTAMGIPLLHPWANRLATDAYRVTGNPHRLALDVALRRRTLTVQTTLTATGDHLVPVPFGFHPLPAPAAGAARAVAARAPRHAP